MHCALDDDRIIVFAMVDFVISVDSAFYIVKHSLLLNLYPPTVLIVGLSSFNQNFSNINCALNDY